MTSETSQGQQGGSGFDIEALARLARISLTEGEKQTYGDQIPKLFDYMKRLEKESIEGVLPMAHAFHVENVWREDVPGECFSPEEALMNAPNQRSNQVCVPKVVE